MNNNLTAPKYTSNILACIQKIDRIYSSSPTARALVNNAPAILQSFNSLKAMAMQNQHELQLLAGKREDDLKRFKDVAPAMLQSLNAILNQIFHLQATVRDHAARSTSDPNARTVIDFTNRQIDQNITLFNNISYYLLNS